MYRFFSVLYYRVILEEQIGSTSRLHFLHILLHILKLVYALYVLNEGIVTCGSLFIFLLVKYVVTVVLLCIICFD